MITPVEITKLIDERVKSYIDAERKLRAGTTDKGPEFYDTYAKSVDMWDRVKVHAVEGTFPYELFRHKAPNQKDSEWEYQKNTYRSVGSPTYPFWSRAMGRINRIWNEKNYSISYPEVSATEYKNQTAKDYFNKDYPGFGSIEAYFKEIVTVQKINDPNAWLAIDILPHETDTEAVKPIALIYNCKNVWGFKPNEWILVLTAEKSIVKYGERDEKTGLIFKVYTPDGIWKIEQYGKKIDYTFGTPELTTTNTFYKFNYLPAWPLKGTPVIDGDSMYYQSYFTPAVSSLNSALLDGSTLQISKNINAFPERWERVADCDAEGCESGIVYGENRLTKLMCGSCGGTGKKNFSSPQSVLQIPVPVQAAPMMPQYDKVEYPYAGYVEKQEATEMLRFLREEFISECEDAFCMINIDVSNSNVKGSETALGKQIDREEEFSFLLQISNELFDLLFNAVVSIAHVRYGTAWKNDQFNIGYPQNFSIRNEEEITEEISEAKKAGLPGIVIESLIRNYAGLRFNSQDAIERKIQTIFNVDRLFSFNPDEITMKLASGIVGKWEAVLHDSIGVFIDEALLANENFLDLPITEQRKTLNAMAQAKTAEITPMRVDPAEIIEKVE